jgi:hypothetical protein
VNPDKDMQNLLKETTGSSDVLFIDFKNLDDTPKEKIDFRKVRGSVRLQRQKIKTQNDVEALIQKFLALRLP